MVIHRNNKNVQADDAALGKVETNKHTDVRRAQVGGNFRRNLEHPGVFKEFVYHLKAKPTCDLSILVGHHVSVHAHADHSATLLCIL